MSYQTILFSSDDGVGRLTFNRPDRLNSFTAEMHREVYDMLGRVMTDGIRVLLITGAGRGFCAGQDLSERDVTKGPLDLGEGPEKYYNPLIRRITSLPLPVVCAVNGVAAGAGMNVAIACDIVLAKKSAKFVQAFSSIGLVPDAGGSWHLPRLMGPARAMGFTLLGESLSAERAMELGLIWRAIDDEAFETEVEVVVQKLAKSPTFGLASAKRALRDGLQATLDAALDLERDLQRSCGLTADYTEGVSSFQEKRKPNFVGK